MNESLYVYLNLDTEKEQESEELIWRMDQLLLTAGMKYSGISNMYIPVDIQKRDRAVFRAEELLRSTDWLKGILAYSAVGTLTNACPIEEIRTDRMQNPMPGKLRYYEQYYQKTNHLPHGIVVDENRQLRDGYISYLLAKKYHARADVCEMVSGQPLRKLVTGVHVVFRDGKWIKKTNKGYNWIYTKKAPVIPGDILLVDTKRGTSFICVSRITYIAGQEFCSNYKKVRKHMKIHMEEAKDTNYGK